MLPPAPFLLSLRSLLAGRSRGDSGKGKAGGVSGESQGEAGWLERSEGCWKKFFLNSIVQALVVVVVVVLLFVIIVVVSAPPLLPLAFSLFW